MRLAQKTAVFDDLRVGMCELRAESLRNDHFPLALKARRTVLPSLALLLIEEVFRKVLALGVVGLDDLVVLAPTIGG